MITGQNGKCFICEINKGSDLRLWQMNKALRNAPLEQWMRKENLLDKW